MKWEPDYYWLSFPAQFACSSETLLAKVLGGVAWMELHVVLAVGLEKLRKTKLRSIESPLFPTSKLP